MLSIALIAVGGITFALATHPATDIGTAERVLSTVAAVATGLLGMSKLVMDITTVLQRQD